MIRRGFTLVELIVAMALTSLLGLMTYALFGISADNLVEVDSLETTAAKGRFAVEKMRTLFQISGSFSSPDSVLDPFVQPRDNVITNRVAGFQSYTGWQDQSFTGDHSDISFDGIILTGAFDFPTSFAAGGILNDNAPMIIPGNFMGMEKLNRVDPFSDVRARDATGAYFPDLELADWSVASSYRFLEPNLASRLIRVTDGLGYVQFLQPVVQANFAFASTDIVDINLGSSRSLWGAQIPLEQNRFKPIFKGDNKNIIGNLDMREIGFDRTGAGEGDRTYEASFIDTYWLHVVSAKDVNDPTNHLLVLERLCASNLAIDAPATGIRNPVDSTPANSCGTESRQLIADRVVDFQIWFDCANPTTGEVANNTNWRRNWISPTGVEPGNNCMAPGPNYAPGLARTAHARLTLRTEEERETFSNQRFVNGETLCANSSACPTATLRSFDINPKLTGAAPVITFQTDVALRNFIIKDL